MFLYNHVDLICLLSLTFNWQLIIFVIISDILEDFLFQGLFSNPIYYIIWISTMVAQVFIVQFGGRWFSTAALNLEQWLWCLAFGVGVLLWGQVICLSFSVLIYT